MRLKFPNLAILDLGSSKIAGLAVNIGGGGEVEVIGSSLSKSAGFRAGVVKDLSEAENSVISAVYDLEKACGRGVSKVSLCLSGKNVKSYYKKHRILLGGKSLTKIDLKKSIQKALADFKIYGKDIIRYFPAAFFLDGNRIDNPVGMSGRELICDLHIVTVDSSSLDNIIKCFSKHGIGINELFPGVYASGLAIGRASEKELKYLVIDLGARITGLGLFEGTNLLHLSYAETGSFDLTSDIAKTYSIGLERAEKLKILYGEEAVSPSIDYSGLDEVIKSGSGRIFLEAKKEFDKIGIGLSEISRIDLVGGGSSLKGLREVVGKIFQKETYTPKPAVYPGFSDDCAVRSYATCLGVASYFSDKAKNSISYDSWENLTTFQKFIEWIKNNF